MAALASVEYGCSDLRSLDVISTNSRFFAVRYVRSLPADVLWGSFVTHSWPSLVSTARSHKPSHKHDSNQSKATVICDHKSEKTRSVVTCENIRFFSLFAAGDVSRETSPATKSEEKRIRRLDLWLT